MAIERILSSDSGKIAFEKSDRNFTGLEQQVNDCLIKRNLNSANIDSDRHNYITCTSEPGHIGDSPYKSSDWTNYVQFDSDHFLTQLAFLQTRSEMEKGLRLRKRYIGDSGFEKWFDIPVCDRPKSLNLLNQWQGQLSIVDASTYMHIFGRITSGINTADTLICNLPSQIALVSYQTVFNPWGEEATALLFFNNEIKIFHNPNNSTDLNINVLIQKSL